MAGPDAVGGPDAAGGGPHVLVVDDDDRLRELLRRFLTENGFRVTTADDAQDARAKLSGLAFDLAVIDVMMPGESGLSLASWLATAAPKATPVLLLTARGEPADRIAGLEAGAEDYLAKPFEPRELVLRLHTILRHSRARGEPSPPPAPAPVRFGDCVFDPAHARLIRDGDPVRLTSGEAALLAALARRPGETLTREALAAAADMSGNERAVDVQVTRLRRKIERDPGFPRYLQTVWGRGYVLRTD